LTPSRAALTSFVLVAALLSCRKSDKVSVRKPDNPIDAALSRADYAKALQLAQSSNTPEAKFYLGCMYNNGWGVTPDPRTAFRYYKDAADAGYVRAKVFLAGAYSQGRGVNKDAAKATQLLQEASSQGDPQAKYLLMMMQANPNQQMTAADEARNKEMLTSAADAGDPIASLIAAMAFAGESAQKPDSGKLAAKYFLAAADSNAMFPGGFATGQLLDNGIKWGASPDDIKAALYRYMDAGSGGLALEYVRTCMHDKANPLCDAVQVIKYNRGTDATTLIGRTGPAYFASLSDSQKQEGQRLAAAWKPLRNMPSNPPDYYVPPLF